jgi:hypothetical protein
MPIERISIAVDKEVARAYRSASESQRRKLDLLVNFRLKDATRSDSSLEDLISEISQNAEQRGLTPEILRSLIDEK